MRKISIKYSIKTNNYESHCIVYNNGDIEISPYNYTEKDIFEYKISRKKLFGFLNHLQEILKIQKIK